MPPPGEAASGGPVAARGLVRRLARLLASILGWTAVVAAFAWACGALWWSPLGPAGTDWVRIVAITLLLAVAVALAWWLRGAARPLALAAAWFIPFAWFWLAPATNDADWEPPSRIAPIIEVAGDLVTVRSVRNFLWRSDTDFDERWEERTYDLSELRTLDLFLSYWGPTLICHTFVSFGFADGRQLVVSVEVRKKKGQTYAPIPSAFREFELIYIFADELDVAYVRSNIRKETVHLFRMKAPDRAIRGLLVEYIERANRMARRPEWYNAITNNCGVNIIQNAWAEGSRRPLSWRLLFNGQWPRYAYESGALDNDQPFETIFAASDITARALRCGHSPDFSHAIRAGTIETYTVPKAYEPTRPPELPPPGEPK